MIQLLSLPLFLPFLFDIFWIVFCACNHTIYLSPLSTLKKCMPILIYSYYNNRELKKPFIREGRKVIPWHHPDFSSINPCISRFSTFLNLTASHPLPSPS